MTLLGHTQYAYTIPATAVFVELPAFERRRARYLDDEAFRALQYVLMRNPSGRGSDSGNRWIAQTPPGSEFWLFTLFDKDEMTDLRPQDRKALKAMVKAELEAKRNV